MILNLDCTRLNKIIFCATMGLLAFALPGCDAGAPSSTKINESIQQLHVRLQDSAADSVEFWLNELELIQSQFSVPDSQIAQTYYYRGRYLYQQGQLDSAATLFHQAISLIRPPISRRQTEYFRMAWSAYSAQGEYGECLALSNRLESLLSTDGTPRQKALLYFIRGESYRQQSDFKKAIDYNTRYIEQLNLARDTQGLASAYIDKAFYVYYVDKDVERTFAILDTLVEREHLYSCNTNRLIHGDYGVYLFFEGDYQGALASYKRGLANVHKMTGETGQDGFLATAYSNIAETYMELGDMESSQAFLDSVYQLGLNRIPEDVRNNTLRYQLKLAYRDRQGLQPVMSALDSIVWYQDQQFLQRNQSELKALQLANEKEKFLLEKNKEEELENLRLRSRQTLLLVVLAIIIWVAYLLYRQRQLRFEKQELQLHQRLLRTQMNPHFTYNTLYAIQTLIKKDPQKAIDYQLKFSRLLRLVLENSTANFVQLDDELIAVEQYLELQLLRFPGKFEYKVVLDGIERNSLIFIPPMLIQPMIENCIEHGFAGIDYTGFISIRIASYNQNLLSCSIEDNGLGISTAEYRSRQAKSTKLIDAFLKKLTPGGLKLIDKAEHKTGGNGVIVKFLIPRKTTANG